MWRALFIGWLAIALCKEENLDVEKPNVKRQTPRGNIVVYGAAPGQYSIQNSEKVASHSQVPADYQQSELYVTSPNRKPPASAFTYSSETPRRPHYIQLSALQLQAAQQVLQHQQLQHQQPQQQQTQQQTQQHQISFDTEAGHGAFYRPVAAVRQQEAEPSAAPTPQYSGSAISDSQLYPQTGSFERELAQLVAANRAQEQKYNAAATDGSVQGKKIPIPQQYLKEITRPVARPVAIAKLPQAYHAAAAAAAAGAPTSIPAHQQVVLPQHQQLYRYVYQPEQIQQIASNSQQQYKSPSEQQYVRPQIQQYLQQQSQAEGNTYVDDTSAAQIAQHSSASARLAGQQLYSPSRSTIYVSQSTPVKKPSYTLPAAVTSERSEEQQTSKLPVVRIPTQRNRPLTQEEFQQLLQTGGYTATLVSANDPNSPHQEYLLHPTAQKSVYPNEKQEAVTYLLPQGHQRPVKRKPNL